MYTAFHYAALDIYLALENLITTQKSSDILAANIFREIAQLVEGWTRGGIEQGINTHKEFYSP
jgi:hypothetical protein